MLIHVPTQIIPEKSFDVNEVLPYTYFDDAALDTIGPINSQDLNPDEMMKFVLNASSQELSTLEDPTNHAAHLEYTPDLLPVDLGYNFDVTMKGDSNSWVLSAGKVFIKMFSAMTINVSYSPQPETLFLRAMVLFDNPNEMHLPVKMCANHAAANVSSSSNMAGPLKHILKCLTPYANHVGVEDGILFKDRLSVVVQLQNCKRDEEGNVSEPIVYDFQCQNSCASGINRKSTSIVFTLEDQQYKILGKRVLPFKVCSCPKRDAEREQLDNKRKLAGNEPFPKGKRPKFAPRNTQLDIKIEPEDSDTAEDADVPKLVERSMKMSLHCWKYVAEAAFNKMTGMMATEPKKHTEFYRKCARDIRKMQESFEDE